jgi:hypothetical protein
MIHPRNIAKRLKYTEDHKDLGSDLWDTVIYSDKASVTAMSKDKEVKHWVHLSANARIYL